MRIRLGETSHILIRNAAIDKAVHKVSSTTVSLKHRLGSMPTVLSHHVRMFDILLLSNIVHTLSIFTDTFCTILSRKYPRFTTSLVHSTFTMSSLVQLFIMVMIMVPSGTDHSPSPLLPPTYTAPQPHGGLMLPRCLLFYMRRTPVASTIAT